MATFKYTALDSAGNEVSGTVKADNESNAASKIRKKGLFPSKILDATKIKKQPGNSKKDSEKKKKGNIELKMPAALCHVPTKKLMVFTRQLSTLVHAGMPLIRCLQVLRRQEKNTAMNEALKEIQESIEGGQNFADSLAQHSKIFDRLYVNMVKAGEVGGLLDEVLNRLAEFMEKAQRLKRKVIGAMIYPMVVVMVAIGFIFFAMTYIIPKFQKIFSDLLGDEGMPALTQMVMGMSKALTENLIPTILITVGVVVAIKLLGKIKRVGYFYDYIKFKIPLFGYLGRISSIARFSRTLGTLMNAGVPILQGLMIVREVLPNQIMQKTIMEVHDNVKEGENIAPTIEESKVFPPIVISMIEVGEETGELPEMLIKVADAYDEEVDNVVLALTSVIEPVLIVLLAFIVGTIVVALFLPLTSLIGGLS